MAGLSVRAWQTRDGASSVTVRAFTQVRRTASGKAAGPGTRYTCHSRCRARRPDFIEEWQETSHASALLLSLQSAVAARHPSHSYIDDKHPHLSSFISQLETAPSLSSLNSIPSSPEITEMTGIGEALPLLDLDANAQGPEWRPTWGILPALRPSLAEAGRLGVAVADSRVLCGGIGNLQC